jgi:hypothetical protein
MCGDSVQLSQIDQGSAFHRFVITDLVPTTLYWYHGIKFAPEAEPYNKHYKTLLERSVKFEQKLMCDRVSILTCIM